MKQWNLQFSSITHLHLFACINTLIYNAGDFKNKRQIRLLDLGCGKGRLLKVLLEELRKKHPAIEFEFYGLDVDDALVQKPRYFNQTIQLLEEADKNTNWNERLYLINSREAWPYNDNFFDIIISNLVMEHVINHAFVFRQIRRTLTYDGYSMRVYPLKYYIFEAHLFMPFVHKHNDYTRIYNAVIFWTKLGFGDYRKLKQQGEVKDLNDFAEKYADKMAFQVNYMYNLQLFETIKQAELKGSFDFTIQFYKQKLRAMLGWHVKEQYTGKELYSRTNQLLTYFFRYIQCITLVLRKKDANFK